MGEDQIELIYLLLQLVVLEVELGYYFRLIKFVGVLKSLYLGRIMLWLK